LFWSVNSGAHMTSITFSPKIPDPKKSNSAFPRIVAPEQRDAPVSG